MGSRWLQRTQDTRNRTQLQDERRLRKKTLYIDYQIISLFSHQTESRDIPEYCQDAYYQDAYCQDVYCQDACVIYFFLMFLLEDQIRLS